MPQEDDFWLIDSGGDADRDIETSRIQQDTRELADLPPVSEPTVSNPFEVDEDDDLSIHELEELDGAGRTMWGHGGYSETRGGSNGNDDEDFDIRRLWRRWILRKSTGSSDGPEHRRVYLNDAVSQSRFTGNRVSTTKYNIATFLPKFLFEQFSKYANLFFLATALIQQVPGVSPTNRYTTIGTLLVVLLTSATKELIEDWKRWRADTELNDSPSQVLGSTGTWITKRWGQLKVGDIVQVGSEQAIPADLVVIATSEPEGLCYVETANLDGETNLKIKQALAVTAKLRSSSQLASATGRIECEQPNSSLYTFDGTLYLDRPQTRAPLGPDQMLLRGTSLRNTSWIYGIVVFTGHETKLMRNATAAPIKRTGVEHMINLQIVFLFLILLAMAIMSSLGNVVRLNLYRSQLWYLQLAHASATSTFFLDLLTYWILFSNLVPISLFVTVEIIKYWQGWLISNDLEMYDADHDVPAVCRTSSLVEELGQIRHIFSDKTGTLTRNVMEFKACFINGSVFSDDIPEERQGEWLRLQQMNDPDLLTILSACHTVIPVDGEYQASSPDEGALVQGAASLGYEFVARRPHGIDIRTPEGLLELELLHICEFNSTRKRMSVVVRFASGEIRLLTKGADTVIFERLQDPSQEREVAHALEEFAGIGLRTLCLAQRVVPSSEYNAWAADFEDAAASLENRAEKLEELAERIEHSLKLVGVTAIEDKLQEGVPETIHALQDAGLKIWVLTGDRQETAINIGMSCKLLSEDMNLLIVNEVGADAVHANILSKIEALATPEATSADFDTLALVVDGGSLQHALQPDIAADFIDLALRCKAVLCCRVSPLQKALVVKLVKQHKPGQALLAIGDGANDVSMIQAANVGVGISGMEGQQAARSADIAIGQFRFLRKLLLVHGSWSYNRLSRAILYSFYKNIALYLTQFWYVFLNGFSGQTIYESWTVTFYNVICTVLPPFALGILDQFVSARLLEKYPQLYRLGQRGVFLSVNQFWQWIADGVYHSLIIFWFGVWAYGQGNTLSNGTIANTWTWGTAVYTSCVLTALGKAALVTNMWNRYTVIAIPGSFLLWLAFFPLYATIAPRTGVSREYTGVLKALYPTVVFWALIFVVAGACLWRDVAWKYWRRMYKPEYYHYVQEIQKYKMADPQPRMDQFQRAIRKARQVTRMRKQRGFAFSQTDDGAARMVEAYERSNPFE